MAAAALGAAEQNVQASGTLGPLAGADIDSLPLAVELRADALSVDDLARLPDVAAALPEALEVLGPLDLALTAQGTWADVRYDAAVDATAADVDYGALRKPAGVPMKLDLGGTRTSAALTIARGRVRSRGAALDISGKVTTSPVRSYDVALRSAAISLPALQPLMPALSPFEVEGSLGVDLELEGAATRPGTTVAGTVVLADLTLRTQRGPVVEKLGTTARLADEKGALTAAKFMLLGAPATLTGRIDMGQKPTLEFALTSKAVPLGDALATGSRAAAADVLRGLRMDGAVRLAAGALKLRCNAISTAGAIGGVPFRDFSVDVRVDNGRAVLTPVSVEVFGGRVRGEGVYDTRDTAEPSFNFDATVSDVRLGDLADAFGAQHARRIDGDGRAKLSLAATGSEWAAITKSLTGGGNVSVDHGAIRGLNLVDGIIANLSSLPGLSAVLSPDLRTRYPALFASQDTLFDTLEARVSISEGRISSDKIAVRAPDFAATGVGSVALDGTVDLRASVELSHALSTDLLAAAGDLRGVANKTGNITVPMRIDGTAPDLRARPELDRIAHALQKSSVQKFVDDILDRERTRLEHSAVPPPTLTAPVKRPIGKRKGRAAAPPPSRALGKPHALTTPPADPAQSRGGASAREHAEDRSGQGSIQQESGPASR
jgi:hypothetical protein